MKCTALEQSNPLVLANKQVQWTYFPLIYSQPVQIIVIWPRTLHRDLIVLINWVSFKFISLFPSFPPPCLVLHMLPNISIIYATMLCLLLCNYTHVLHCRAMAKETCTLRRGLEFFMKVGWGQMAFYRSWGEEQIYLPTGVSEQNRSHNNSTNKSNTCRTCFGSLSGRVKRLCYCLVLRIYARKASRLLQCRPSDGSTGKPLVHSTRK